MKMPIWTSCQIFRVLLENFRKSLATYQSTEFVETFSVNISFLNVYAKRMAVRFLPKLGKRIFVPFNRVHFGPARNRNLIAIV